MLQRLKQCPDLSHIQIFSKNILPNRIRNAGINEQKDAKMLRKKYLIFLSWETPFDVT